jgi:hypothetical protein
MIRAVFLALLALVAVPAAALDRGPPAQRTGPIAITGPGSTGDVSGMSVVPNGATASQTLGAWFSSFVFGTPTATTLRVFPRTVIFDGAIINVSGYTTAGDGGGGLFRWSASSTATDDGVLVFAPNGGGTGRWLRVFDGALSILATGAVCDGSTDASARAQVGINAVTAQGPGGTMLLPANGACKLGGLTWSGGSTFSLRGVGPNSYVVPNSPTATIFSATAGRVEFSDFTVFSPPGYSTGGYFFYFKGCNSCRLNRVDTFNGYSLAFWDVGSGDAFVTDVTSFGLAKNGLAFDVSPALPATQKGIIEVSRVRLRGGSTNTGNALTVVSGDTFTMSDSNLDGFQTGAVFRTKAGGGYLANIFINNALVDAAGAPSTTYDGWIFDGTATMLTRVVMNNSWSSGMGGRGMYFTNVSDVTINGMRVINSGLDGVVFDTGAKHIGFYQGTVSANSAASSGTRHGITLLNGSNDITIKDTRSGPSNANVDGSQADTQTCAIVVQSSVTGYRLQDNDLRGNASGLCDSGGGTAATAGAATSSATKFVFDNRIGAYTP